MANNSVPKHDFAPAWLKIPHNGNAAQMSLKSYVGNSVEQQHENEKPGRHSRWDGYHGNHSNNADSSYAQSRQRHSSFDNHYVHRASQVVLNEWRSLYHHSLDSEGSDYSDSSNHSIQNKHSDHIYQSGHSRYWNHYGPHVNSSPRRSQSRADYRDVTYKDLNPVYHNGNSAQSHFHQDAFTQGGHISKLKNEHNHVDSSQEYQEENLLNSDFPSLRKESLMEEIVKPVNGGVWDNPPNSKVHNIGAGRKIQLVQKSIKGDIREKSSNQSGNNLSTSSNIMSQKSNPHTAIINQNNKTTIQNQANSAIYKVFVPSKIPSRQSPTPPLEILSTRFVTQPKTLSNKKSDFLKTLRSDQGKNDSGEENKNEDSEDEKVINQLTVTKESYEDTNDHGINMQHLSVDPPQRAILSSSLEAEQRLLREMGWKDEGSGDEGVYAPLTEDELKEFRILTEKVQQRNGLTKTLPINWSPKHTPFSTTNLVQIPNDTWTSSSDESDFD